MTLTLEAEMHEIESPAVHVYGQARLLAGVAEHGRVDFDHHVTLHGAITTRRRSWLSKALNDVNLLGRGGGAFPVNVKFDAMPQGSSTAVLVNGSEGEPASMKDRVLMRTAPHVVIDGALVVAHALGTRRIAIAVHDRASHDSLRAACKERPDARRIVITHTGDGFVGGEIRAVINGLNGSRAVPGGRRVLPVHRGIENRPTFASNVETFAHVGILAGLGVAEFSRVGSADEPGTTLITVIGDVPYPGVAEVPIGVPISALLHSSGNAPVLIGGYHGTWVADTDGLVVNRAKLKAAGVPLNAGVIARTMPGTCVVDEVVRISEWLAGESAGQCGPCFFGLPAIASGIASLAAGGGTEPLAALRRRLGVVPGRGACAHPDGSVQFVGSALSVLDDEFRMHADHGSCGLPTANILRLPTKRTS
ncbi:MAG: NADH-ubiquinone oxidoreductase-F iron-sulfur binding region domain-containing protein [Aeromicrobium sp.]